MTPDDDRLSALERQVAALSAEVQHLREGAASARTPLASSPAPSLPPTPSHDPLARERGMTASLGEEEIESVVGRYGTLVLGAVVLLMGLGVLIQFAVIHGLLTPAVRVGIGAFVAACVGAAGVWFHRRGEVRYANVLLALALAMTDLVAWGAGPSLHLVPTTVSLAVVDLVALALCALALHDGSEFLFGVAIAAALSAPFVTMDTPAAPDLLLAYGGVVLIGSLRAVTDPQWGRAVLVLLGGALAYALYAAGSPLVGPWHSPFAVSLFSGACALGAVLLADEEWRSRLSRAFLLIGLLGVPTAWDSAAQAAPWMTWSVALGLAAVTYAALALRERAILWTASAFVLPFVSLGIASAARASREAQAGVFALWALFALTAWQLERRLGDARRGAVHLTVGALLMTVALWWLLWPRPLLMVAAFAAWGVAMAAAAGREERLLPLVGVAAPLVLAAASAIDQLATRRPFTYVPFTTRSSASALVVAVGLGIAGAVLARADGPPSRLTGRAIRLGSLIAFLVLWGRMELAGAWTRDLAAFLLIAYYAACGLASILVGRRLGVSRLRLGGLGLAIYAAIKAIVEASDIGELMLRVGAYGAVGVFLLAAGYIYREAGVRGRLT